MLRLTVFLPDRLQKNPFTSISKKVISVTSLSGMTVYYRIGRSTDVRVEFRVRIWSLLFKYVESVRHRTVEMVLFTHTHHSPDVTVGFSQ